MSTQAFNVFWCTGQSRAEGEPTAVREPMPTACTPDRPIQEKSHYNGTSHQKPTSLHTDAGTGKQKSPEDLQL